MFDLSDLDNISDNLPKMLEMLETADNIDELRAILEASYQKIRQLEQKREELEAACQALGNRMKVNTEIENELRQLLRDRENRVESNGSPHHERILKNESPRRGSNQLAIRPFFSGVSVVVSVSPLQRSWIKPLHREPLRRSRILMRRPSGRRTK